MTPFLIGGYCTLTFVSHAETVEVPANATGIYSEDHTDEELQPEITIIKKKDGIYEEYRLNGKLYMIKVIPVVGPPYFYIDRDGDGVLESNANSINPDDMVPNWVIFSW